MSQLSPQLRDGQKSVFFYVTEIIKTKFATWCHAARTNTTEALTAAVQALTGLPEEAWAALVQAAAASRRTLDGVLLEWILIGYRQATQALGDGPHPALALAGPGVAPEGGAHDVDTQDRKRLDRLERELIEIKKMLERTLGLRRTRGPKSPKTK